MKLMRMSARIGKEFTLAENNGIYKATGLIAVPKSFVKPGERDVYFVFVTCFAETARYIAKYGKKGAMILLKDWEVHPGGREENYRSDYIIRQVEIVNSNEE